MRFAHVIYIRFPYTHAIISLLSNTLVHKKQYKAIWGLYFGKRTVHATPTDKFENSTLFVCLGLPPTLIDYLIQSSAVSLTSLIVVAECLCSQGFLSAISCSSNEYFHALSENRCHNFAQSITDSTPESWMRQRFTYVYIFDITWSQISLCSHIICTNFWCDFCRFLQRGFFKKKRTENISSLSEESRPMNP